MYGQQRYRGERIEHPDVARVRYRLAELERDAERCRLRRAARALPAQGRPRTDVPLSPMRRWWAALVARVVAAQRSARQA